jgi:molybdenum cofactor cytidylyltransferase
MISGILLAAGESSRMQGAFKPLLKWGKRTVIGECVHQMRNSQLAEIFVVLGHREMEIRQTLAGSGVQYAINEDYRRGMLSSIKTGLALLSPNEDAALIALVDQPMITKEIVDTLIDAFAAGGKGVALPTYEGKRGHPVIIAAKYFDDIMRLDEDSPEGLRRHTGSPGIYACGDRRHRLARRLRAAEQARRTHLRISQVASLITDCGRA